MFVLYRVATIIGFDENSLIFTLKLIKFSLIYIYYNSPQGPQLRFMVFA